MANPAALATAQGPRWYAFLAGQLGDFTGNPAFRQGAGEFKNNRNIFAGPNVFGTTNNGPTQDAQDINSSYHSLQLSVEKRMSHGLTILGNYT